MSLIVPLDAIDAKSRREITRKCTVKEKTDPRSLFRNVKEVSAYSVEGGMAVLPFQWAMRRYGAYRRPRSQLSQSKARFVGDLRPEQIQIQKEAITHLNDHGSTLIAVYPGGGKTITSLSLCGRIGLKTLILVNRLVLIDQWKRSIESFFNDETSAQVLDARTPPDAGADFYIMNAINVPKRGIGDFQDIGTVIVDECHMMITQVFIRALLYVSPRYLIGLSATPYRPDGLDILLDLYFGEQRIVRTLYRPHTVYLLETGLDIQGEVREGGGLDWNSVLQVQMNHPGRNHCIARLVGFFRERNILILCKRVQQIETLHALISPNATCATLKGNETEYDTEARVLVASIQKVGTGFSHDRLDMLILACDTEEYFLQYLGRVFRRPDVVPIVIDIIDKNPVLRRHSKTRRKVYTECGGSIYVFRSIFPEFDVGITG